MNIARLFFYFLEASTYCHSQLIRLECLFGLIASKKVLKVLLQYRLLLFFFSHTGWISSWSTLDWGLSGQNGPTFHTAYLALHRSTQAISISNKSLSSPSSPTLIPHCSSWEHKRLNSRNGTDPTGCLGSYIEITEVSILTVIQPQERWGQLFYCICLKLDIRL